MKLHLIFSRMTKPVVTAINGAAMGGGAGLAIAGDLAVMAEARSSATRRPSTASSPRSCMANLVRQVGRKAAFELVASASRSTPQRALAAGAGQRVVPDEELIEEALRWPSELAAVSRPAMAETKRLFHEVADLPLDEALAKRARGQPAHARRSARR